MWIVTDLENLVVVCWCVSIIAMGSTIYIFYVLQLLLCAIQLQLGDILKHTGSLNTCATHITRIRIEYNSVALKFVYMPTTVCVRTITSNTYLAPKIFQQCCQMQPNILRTYVCPYKPKPVRIFPMLTTKRNFYSKIFKLCAQLVDFDLLVKMN